MRLRGSQRRRQGFQCLGETLGLGSSRGEADPKSGSKAPALLQTLPQTRCVSSTVSQTSVCVVCSGPDMLPVQDRTRGALVSSSKETRQEARMEMRLPGRPPPPRRCLGSPRTSGWDDCPSGPWPPVGLVPGRRLLPSLGERAVRDLEAPGSQLGALQGTSQGQ